MGVKITVATAATAVALTACSSSIFTLAAGECFDDGDTKAGEVSSLPIVDCSKPHDNEIFATFELPDDEFPGQAVLQLSGNEDCIDRFSDWAGIGYAESALIVFPITPTSSSWGTTGDREVACVVYDSSLEKLTGSMAGAGY
jgi:hypothetical protein